MVEMRRNFLLVARYTLKFTRCSLLVARCKITRYSLQNLLVTPFRSCSLQKFTRYSLQNIRSLLVAEVARRKNSLVVKNHSLLIAKFNRYLLHKFS